MTQRSEQPLPMRIEMATSEIEGAATVAWADPGQVLACVSWVQPADTFERFIEPRLAGIDRGVGGAGAEPAEASVPGRVHAALERLRQAHVRLYRENQSGRHGRREARVVLMLVEDDRVYLIKGIPCWVFILRDGLATPAGSGGIETPERPGLGTSEKLSLAVTSLQVKANDVVVLLAAAAGEEPDRRAVAGVFEQTQDLKRACDGLVNLFRTGEEGAGAVAVRFVPVGSAGTVGDFALMEDLERVLRRDLAERTPAQADSVADELPEDFALPEMELPEFLRDESPEVPTAVEEPALPESDIGSRAVPPEMPLEIPPEIAPEVPAQEPSHQEPVGVALSSAETEPVASIGPPNSRIPHRPHATRKWPWLVGLAVVILGIVAVAGVPRGLRMLHRGATGGDGGVLRIEPTPPARAISIDGVDQGTGSPAILEGVAAGPHRVRLDLGAFGSIEVKVRVREGETTDLAPRAVGGLEIAAAEARPGAQVWFGDGARRTVPCRIDSLPVGWHEVFYEDDRLPLWERSVLVRANETSRVRVNNAFATDRALLKIESWEFRAGEGLREAAGDSAYIDGRFVGRTPFEAEVAPGLHGVRVRGTHGQVWTEVAELTAGSSRVVAPRFGMGDWPRIRHQQPGTIYLRGPVLLTVRIETPDGEAPRNPRLHLPELNASVRDIPLSPVGDEAGAYVGMVDPQWVPVDRPVTYYFTVQTGSGETLSSELYRFRATTDLSQGVEFR
jgi:hypothetical protein